MTYVISMYCICKLITCNNIQSKKHVNEAVMQTKNTFTMKIVTFLRCRQIRTRGNISVFVLKELGMIMVLKSSSQNFLASSALQQGLSKHLVNPHVTREPFSFFFPSSTFVTIKPMTQFYLFHFIFLWVWLRYCSSATEERLGTSCNQEELVHSRIRLVGLVRSSKFRASTI